MFSAILCLARWFSRWPKPSCPQLAFFGKIFTPSVWQHEGLLRGVAFSLEDHGGLFLHFSLPSLATCAADQRGEGTWAALGSGERPRYLMHCRKAPWQVTAMSFCTVSACPCQVRTPPTCTGRSLPHSIQRACPFGGPEAWRAPHGRFLSGPRAAHTHGTAPLQLKVACVRAAAEGLVHAGCWPSCCLTLSGLARRREAFSLPSVMLMDIWTGPRGTASCLAVTGAL